MKRLFFIMFLISHVFAFAENTPKIIPQPNHMEIKEGFFTIEKKLFINDQFTQTGDPTNKKVTLISQYFQKSLGKSNIIETKDQSLDSSLLIIKSNPELGEEAYELEITENKITIEAASEKGLFYSLQTLKQIFFNENDLKAPILTIQDQPYLSYRGVHLDVCRHFYSTAFIKKILNTLSYYKINTFHWHLTEDQGWRIQIDKYPKLTEIGAYRKETIIGKTKGEYDGKKHGGFYTKEDIKEVVAYAAEREITVIPEIEMPGHALAALASYPELGCTGGPYETATRWGVFKDVYCAGKEETFEFLENVLEEVIPLFPSPYIHIGGDECPKARWKECPLCQKRIREEGLKNEHELQSYFIKRIENFLLSRDKKLIGWDEILEGGLAPSATVMSWRGEDGGIKAANMGHDVIMTPNSHLYFDYYQGNPETEPLAIGGLITLEDVYGYNPVSDKIDKQKRHRVIGVQANLWTEYIKTEKQAEYMLFPRTFALAEIAWTQPANKDLSNFKKKLDRHFDFLKKHQVNFRNKLPAPITPQTYLSFLDKETVVFSSPSNKIQIHYTTNGETPHNDSPVYAKPITVEKNMKVKAISYDPKEDKYSDPVTVVCEKLDFLKPLNPSSITAGVQGCWAKGAFSSALKLEEKDFTQNKIMESISSPDAALESDYALYFKGYIEVPEKGIYDIKLESDDGSVLWINEEIAINNDGFHAPKSILRSFALKKGFYSFRVKFFQGGGGHALSLLWKKRDENEWKPWGPLFH